VRVVVIVVVGAAGAWMAAADSTIFEGMGTAASCAAAVAVDGLRVSTVIGVVVVLSCGTG